METANRRTVPAASTARPEVAAASSVFNWRGNGADSASAPSTTVVSAAPRAASAQFRVCEALVLRGTMTREQLIAALSGLSTKQVGSAVDNAAAARRITRHSGLYSITALGRAWVDAGGATQPNEPTEAAAPPAPAPTPTPAPTAPPAPAPTPWPTGGFVSAIDGITVDSHARPPAKVRCFVDSDGGFALFKGPTSIELDKAEFRHVLDYLDRMAEPDPEPLPT